MRRQTEFGQKVALGVVALMILAACGTRHKAPKREAKVQQKTLVGGRASLSADTTSTLTQLSSFLPDSSLSDSLKGAGGVRLYRLQQKADTRRTRPDRLDSLS